MQKFISDKMYEKQHTQKDHRSFPYFQKELKNPIDIHFSQMDQYDIQDMEIHISAFITLAPQTAASLKLHLKVEINWIHRLTGPAPLGPNIFD